MECVVRFIIPFQPRLRKRIANIVGCAYRISRKHSCGYTPVALSDSKSVMRLYRKPS